MWGSGGMAPLIFTPSRDGGEWTASHSGRFTTGGTASDSTDTALGGRRNSSQHSKERKLSLSLTGFELIPEALSLYID
jgi:hypothetical protein